MGFPPVNVSCPEKADTPADYFRHALQLQANHRPLEAARAYAQALEAQPDFFEAAFNLGWLLQEMGRLEEALGCYREAARLRPNAAMVWSQLGLALRAMGRNGEAIGSFRRALELQPDSPEILNLLGNVFRAERQYGQAIAYYRAALQGSPDHAGIQMNLGIALRQAGQLGEAVAWLRSAVRLQPNWAEAHFDLAVALLLQGDFQEGFAEYEWRWRRADFAPRQFAAPLWRGEDPAGRTVLVHTEQGAGDAIQFARFLEPLAARGARVVLECPVALAPVLRSAAGVECVRIKGETLPSPHWHVPLMSLPHRLGISLATLPARVPYLHAPPGRHLALPRWSRPGAPALRVGLVWQGTPQPYLARSLPFHLLEPLLALEERVAFYRLQLPAKPGSTSAITGQAQLQDLSGLIRDYGDTAALMEQLDLIISIDTSAAHLAGALGRPVWTLLPFAPDWRWLLQRADCPWYPTMRLFRQPAPGDWSSVVATVRAALLERLQERQSKKILSNAKVLALPADN